MSERDKLTTALIILVLLLMISGYLAVSGLSTVFREPDALRRGLLSLGAWALVAIVIGQILQVLIPIIPGQFLGMAAGYLYGALWGTLISTIGLMLGSWLAMWLARRLGRPLVERYASPAFIERLDTLSERHGFWAFFLVFLLPFLPTDPGCFVAGLTKLPISPLVVLSALGRLPGVFLLCLFGTTSQHLGWQPAAVLFAITAIGAAIIIRYRARLQDTMFLLMARWGLE